MDLAAYEKWRFGHDYPPKKQGADRLLILSMEKKLRSHRWFYGINETGLQHKGSLRSAGINMDEYSGQPIIGIANTWSELNSCNMSLRSVSEEVKKGILEAGGIPLEFPVISLGEELMKPTAMLYRNLLAMEIEETLRAYPLDGVILLGNCDKTIPGLLMGAISANLPAIQLNGGPKKPGVFKGKKLGSGTDLWKYWDDLRIGKITQDEWEEIGKSLSCGFGSCNTMGTASTMNGLLEAMGMMPLGLSTLPVDSSKRWEISKDAGKRIVDMVMEDLKPSDIITSSSLDNAITACMALGGSTNAVIHLTAIAGRRNFSVYPERFEEIGSKVPCIADVQPSGKKLMDEFNDAGGIPALLSNLKDHLNLTAKTYTGETLKNLLKSQKVKNQTIIRAMVDPVIKAPTLVVLHGNLAPDGAVLKVSAASPHLFSHTGPALVFKNYADMLERIDDPLLDVDEDSILVLQNAGPKGVPGMPEWGMIPIPKKLQEKGICDMVRVSDSRMSGTSFGTVILHVAPESAAGGPLSLVQDNDIIELNVQERKIEWKISAEELEKRTKSRPVLQEKTQRGYPGLYIREVLQANQGCDFRFLKPETDEDLNFIQPLVGRS